MDKMHMKMSNISDLVGMRIVNARHDIHAVARIVNSITPYGKLDPKLMDSDESYLIEFEDGRTLALRTEIDCCNRVWFEHIEHPAGLIGATLMGFDVKEWRECMDGNIKGGDECEELLQFDMLTTAGHSTFEVRNNHNGYYGGAIEWYLADERWQGIAWGRLDG